INENKVRYMFLKNKIYIKLKKIYLFKNACATLKVYKRKEENILKKKGMSLIVLVIAILVMIILAGVVVASLIKNNPIGKAEEATFKADISSFKDELNLKVITKLKKNPRLKYTDVNAAGNDMLPYIPSMTKSYIEKLEIVDAELVFIGEKESEKEWAEDVNVPSVIIPGMPVIRGGLTPIKWVNNIVRDTDTKDKDWFDYSNKKWPNARTADNSMWTWIPRYAYRIIYYNGAVVNNIGSGNIIGYSDSRGVVDASGAPSTSFNKLNGRVEIVLLAPKDFRYFDGKKFVGDVTKADGTDNPNRYVVHPAFSAERRKGYTKKADGNFGSTEEIPGFWVSKFEMGPESVSKNGIKPQRAITVSTMFEEGKKIASKRGITGGDSMNMTNTQWGAVAYFTRALGREPAVNANSNYITGNGDYTKNLLQSTTGNATGIYDMSGCGYDAMSSYVNKQGLDVQYIQKLVDNKDTKYVDVYAVGPTNRNDSNFTANSDKYGDATYEIHNNAKNTMNGWSGCVSLYPNYNSNIFTRGGDYGVSVGIKGLFKLNGQESLPNFFCSWRRSLHYVANIYKY
ncbi:MAG: hypothetical protein RR662_08095, partial [Clostridia bacterium]